MNQLYASPQLKNTKVLRSTEAYWFQKPGQSLESSGKIFKAHI